MMIDNESGEVTEEKRLSILSADIFLKISETPVTQEQAEILLADANPDDLDILPTGEIYLTQSKYRQRLNQAFGPGGWAMRPLSQAYIQDNLALQEWSLYAGGQFMAYAVGKASLIESNNRMDWGDVLETVKSNALMRLCKDLGIASECWDKRFTDQFKEKYCIQVYRKKTNKPQWRRADSPPWYDETGILSKNATISKTEQAGKVQSQNTPPPTRQPTSVSQPPKQKPAPTPQPTNNEPKQKSDPWPAKSGKVADFCNQVRRLTGDPDLNGTGYYTSQFHLNNALKDGFGDLSNPSVFDAKVVEAIAHAKQGADEEAAKTE